MTARKNMRFFSGRISNYPLRKLLLVVVGCAVIIFLAFQFISITKKKTGPVVAIVCPQEDAEVDEIVSALKKELRSMGYRKHKGDVRYKTLRVEDAEDITKALNDAMSSGAKMVLAFTGPITRTVVKEVGGKVPVIYCTVGEPCLDSISRQEYPPIMGISIPSLSYEEVLDFLHVFLLDCTRVGVVHSLQMSDATLRSLEVVDKARGMKIIAIKEDSPYIRDFPGKVDGVLIMWGVNKKVSEDIIEAGLASKVPIFAEDKALCEKGAIGFSISCSNVGKYLAGVVDKLLKGKYPVDAPIVEEKGQPVVYVNLLAAKSFGIEVSIPPLLKPVE